MTARKTRDLCSDCWYVVNPTQYFPDQADRLGECSRCEWRQVIVARSHIADEMVDDGPPAPSRMPNPSAAKNRARQDRLIADQRRADLYAHLRDEHALSPREALTDLQLSHAHAVAHLDEADALHVTSRITGRIR